jgi:hypothetical protein
VTRNWHRQALPQQASALVLHFLRGVTIPMPPSLPIFLVVAAAFFGASAFIERRSGVRDLLGSWTPVLVLVLAVTKSLYADRLPLDDWSKSALWLAMLAVPYLSLQWFFSRRKRQGVHAPGTDKNPPRQD